LPNIRQTLFRSFVIKIINRVARLQEHSASHHLALLSRRIYSRAHLPSLPAHLSSVVLVVQTQVRSVAQAQLVPLVQALEASDKPSPRSPQRVLEREFLDRPLVSLNSNSHNNNSNLRASGASGNLSSSPHPGPACLVRLVVRLGNRISQPLPSGVAVPLVQQV